MCPVLTQRRRPTTIAAPILRIADSARKVGRGLRPALIDCRSQVGPDLRGGPLSEPQRLQPQQRDLTPLRCESFVYHTMPSTTTVRELRGSFPKVKKLVEKEGSVIVSDHGEPKYILKLYTPPP